MSDSETLNSPKRSMSAILRILVGVGVSSAGKPSVIAGGVLGFFGLGDTGEQETLTSSRRRNHPRPPPFIPVRPCKSEIPLFPCHPLPIVDLLWTHPPLCIIFLPQVVSSTAEPYISIYYFFKSANAFSYLVCHVLPLPWGSLLRRTEPTKMWAYLKFEKWVLCFKIIALSAHWWRYAKKGRRKKQYFSAKGDFVVLF